LDFVLLIWTHSLELRVRAGCIRRAHSYNFRGERDRSVPKVALRLSWGRRQLLIIRYCREKRKAISYFETFMATTLEGAESRLDRDSANARNKLRILLPMDVKTEIEASRRSAQ
jgi:hypothetical protein